LEASIAWLVETTPVGEPRGFLVEDLLEDPVGTDSIVHDR